MVIKYMEKPTYTLVAIVCFLVHPHFPLAFFHHCHA